MRTDGGVLIERSFEVPVSAARAWQALADVESWPSWAPHITRASLRPPGPVGAGTSGTFRFRPLGRSRFTMTEFSPPTSWTWTGRALGVWIEYDHVFEALSPTSARLSWIVRSRDRRGIRARLFAAVYARLVDRAWPRFVDAVSSLAPPQAETTS